jgi:hypothetical protein
MRDHPNILKQRLVPLKEEEVQVIGELATMQGRVKKAVMESEDKIINLTMQGVEEITAIEETIIKEV